MSSRIVLCLLSPRQDGWQDPHASMGTELFEQLGSISDREEGAGRGHDEAHGGEF